MEGFKWKEVVYSKCILKIFQNGKSCPKMRFVILVELFVNVFVML